MENDQKQTNYDGKSGYSGVVKTQVYVAPAPKKDCDCAPDAPCRLSGICTCDLAALTNQLKQEIKTSEKDDKRN